MGINFLRRLSDAERLLKRLFLYVLTYMGDEKTPLFDLRVSL